MKVFISWSGESSQRVAEALRNWLPQVIQAIQPWISSDDVDKGARWGAEIAAQLEATKVGILCLSPDNLTAPWLLYEAGALSKTVANTYVCPFLLGLEVTDIEGPLAQFQATRANREDTLRLVKTINGALPDGALKEPQLEAAFTKWWPDLEARLAQAPQQGLPATPPRSERSIIEEILEIVRATAREASERESFTKLVGKALVAAPLPQSSIEQAFLEGYGERRLDLAIQKLGERPDPTEWEKGFLRIFGERHEPKALVMALQKLAEMQVKSSEEKKSEQESAGPKPIEPAPKPGKPDTPK